MSRQMNNHNNRHSNRTSKKRGYKINYGKLMLLIGMLFFLVVFGANVAKASDEGVEVRNKIYTSITIKKGDTLWDIANEYADSSYTTKEYINELMQINNLNSTKIKSGNKLIVFYFEQANLANCHLEWQ